MSSQLSRSETLSLAALSLACATILANTFSGEGAGALIASLALSGLGFAASYAMIRWLGPTFRKAGLQGRDMAKVNNRDMLPECMGAVCAVVYLLIIIVFIPFPFYKDIVLATSGGGNRDVVMNLDYVQKGRLLHKFPHTKLASYLAAIISLQFITILGIGDDLFDIRWRHKFFIPAFASIPLLVVYFIDFGVTSIVLPTFLQPYAGRELLDLGFLYYAYMAAFCIFSPNSINILAGINGIEVSQSIVIALLLAFNDVLYLITPYPHPATDSHLFSLYFLLPFLGVSFALWMQNKYPARVFVGDTYCYFAGMVFVMVSILGHFSKTLILLLIPPDLQLSLQRTPALWIDPLSAPPPAAFQRAIRAPRAERHQVGGQAAETARQVRLGASGLAEAAARHQGQGHGPDIGDQQLHNLELMARLARPAAGR
ncbi:UDP-N-acetylglucosamine-dolichyl-phosphate N-acetylglucosaminephosphate transferase [Apiospora arundinis]